MINYIIPFTTLIFSLMIGLPIIHYINAIGGKQVFRQEGPKEHIQSKSKTPTIGGLIFLIPVFLMTLYTMFAHFRSFNFDLIYILMTTLFMASLGFIDDYYKVKKKNNKGLSGKIKLLIQFIVSIIFFLLYKDGESIFLILWIFFVFAGSCNAYNLTDGLDGLLGSISISTFIGLASLAYFMNRIDIFAFCLIFIFALIGFLFFNKHPAKIFMGDTGSIAIGGVVGTVALILNKEWLLGIFALIPIIETISVILQVIYFKITKKIFGEGRRIFKMTPLHHHFELLGWHETKIVKVFAITQLVITLVGIYILIINGLIPA